MTYMDCASDFNPSTHPPLMLDAVCRSRRGDLCRAARRSGTVLREVGGRAGPERTPRALAGSPADLRGMRERLVDAARRLRKADGR